VIRRARVDEAAALLALWRDAGSPPSMTDSVERITAVLERPDSWVLVWEEDGAVVGTLIVTWDGWRGHFYRLAVLPAWRRRGIALRLVDEGEALLRAAGAKRLTAIVLTNRDEAIGFWEAAGFARHVEAARFTKSI
jgi:ribosomal protein S18 acetylase RimI-like enzyme